MGYKSRDAYAVTACLKPCKHNGNICVCDDCYKSDKFEPINNTTKE